MKPTKQTLTAFILGALAITFAYHAYMVYELKNALFNVEKVAAENQYIVGQIVDLINQNQGSIEAE